MSEVFLHMLMILAQLGCSESFWAVVKVRSPHTGPGISYIIPTQYTRAPEAMHMMCGAALLSSPALEPC